MSISKRNSYLSSSWTYQHRPTHLVTKIGHNRAESCRVARTWCLVRFRHPGKTNHCRTAFAIQPTRHQLVPCQSSVVRNGLPVLESRILDQDDRATLDYGDSPGLTNLGFVSPHPSVPFRYILFATMGHRPHLGTRPHHPRTVVRDHNGRRSCVPPLVFLSPRAFRHGK